MAVGVVRPDGDQSDPGAAGRQEVRVRVGAAVVRHLEHVGPQVRAVADEAGLRLGAEVSGEEHPDAPDRHPHDHGQVVRGGRRGRPAGVGGKDLERRVAHGAAVARDQDGPLRRVAPHEAVEGRHPGVGR